MATEVISREAQRAAPRFAIPTTRPVRIDLGPAGSGQVLQISESGIRVRSMAALRRDTELPLRIDIPETVTSLRCAGVVVWSKPTGAAGLRFTKLDDEQKYILGAWLQELKSGTATEAVTPDEFTRIIGQIKAMKLNNADALSLVVRRVTQLTNASGVAIALGKPENMVCLGRGGAAPELGAIIPPGVGLTGECVRGRKLVVCQDVTTDPRAGELKHGSALISPLLVNGEVRGVMQVFSAQPRAFDQAATDTVEKLADAVLFVAYNVTPQRRMASMPQTAASASPALPHSFDSKVTSISSRPASAPPVSKPSESGRIGAFTGPVVKLPVISPPSPVTIVAPEKRHDTPITYERAETEAPTVPPIALVPIAAAVEDVPVQPIRVERPQAPARAHVPSSPMTYHVRSRKPAWLVVVPVAAVVVTAAGALYWAQHRSHVAPAVTVATVATAPSTAVAPATPAPVENASVTTPVVMTTAAAAPVSVAVEKPVTISTAETKAPEKKATHQAPAEPKAEPMVIASGGPVPRAPKVDDSDIAAPSAAGIGSGSSLPGIALPSGGVAPKLVAPRAKVWTGGTLLQRVQPAYPQASLANRVEGKVVLTAVITTNGTVDRIRKVSGDGFLTQATIDAVKRWRYEPYMLDGQPMEKEVTIEVNFKAPRQ